MLEAVASTRHARDVGRGPRRGRWRRTQSPDAPPIPPCAAGVRQGAPVARLLFAGCGRAGEARSSPTAAVTVTATAPAQATTDVVAEGDEAAPDDVMCSLMVLDDQAPVSAGADVVSASDRTMPVMKAAMSGFDKIAAYSKSASPDLGLLMMQFAGAGALWVSDMAGAGDHPDAEAEFSRLYLKLTDTCGWAE
jgi:hypothetical protein